MKIKKLLVYEDSTDRSYILLKGKWLRRLDFDFHDRLELELYKEKIIIKKAKDQSKNLL